MLGWFILGVTFLGGVLLLARWFVMAEPREVLRAIKIAGFVLILALVAFLALTGRLGLALAALPAAVAWFLRFYSVARIFRQGFTVFGNFARMRGQGASGQTSAVETRFLHMTLDHDSGAMGGRIVEGAFAGRDLDSLSDAEQVALLAECRQGDGESAQVLEAYLDRMRPGWRDRDTAQGADGGAGFTPGAMSPDEALKILGLAPDAGPDAVKAAHRRLMAGLHPDHGGSDYLAAKINQAKDVLLHRN